MQNEERNAEENKKEFQEKHGPQNILANHKFRVVQKNIKLFK